MDQYLRKMAEDWVKSYRDFENILEPDPLFIFEQIVSTSASMGWQLMMNTIEIDETRSSLDMLIAGPFSTFISIHGSEWIDVIETEAQTSPKLRWVLGGVSSTLFSKNSWARIQAVRGEEWLPFSPRPPFPAIKKLF